MALTAVRAYFFIISNEFVNANKFEPIHMIAGFLTIQWIISQISLLRYLDYVHA